MSFQSGDRTPDFEAETTQGRIGFRDWIGDSWAVLSSRPEDFAPLLTRELGYMPKLKLELDRRNDKLIGLCVDRIENHAERSIDIEEAQCASPDCPLIGLEGARASYSDRLAIALSSPER
ncbi:MAG: redoxin domain-containing protein [Methylocystis sp.]